MPDNIATIRAFGLTGGIASGKTTVAQCFENLGAKIIDADRVGHELLRSDSPAYPQIVSAFGPEILAATAGPGEEPLREIDRQRLAALVFANDAKRHALNAILHPLILLQILESVNQTQEREPGKVTVVEAPLIYEAGIEKSFLKVIVVWCRSEQQLERLLTKGSITRAQAESRVAAQMPVDEKRRRADYVIDASSTLDRTLAQARELFPELQKMAAGTP